MRISDWSSDVCSSDLATGSLPDLDPPVVALAVDTAGAEREGVGGQPLPDRRLQRRAVLADHAAAADLLGDAGEVGLGEVDARIAVGPAALLHLDQRQRGVDEQDRKRTRLTSSH